MKTNPHCENSPRSTSRSLIEKERNLHRNSFERNKKKILGILASGILSSCGGGGDESARIEKGESPEGRAHIMSVSVPLTSVPTSAPFEVDGKMGYGWIYFEHPINGYAGGPYINPFQVNSYNPRDVLTRLGTTEWIIVRASFTYDTDKNNDGVTDSNWTPINASMSMILHRSVFERGEKIIFSPRAALMSESLMSRPGRIISQEALDSMARESISTDSNNDGVINYADITGRKWATTPGDISIPGFSSYMESAYINNGVNRGYAIKTHQKMQNHTILKILPHSSHHDPVLSISTFGGSSILYTLDGSTPTLGGATTQIAASPLSIALQDKKIYFREVIGSGTSQFVGKVKSFDLSTDWMELSQEGQKYNPNGKESIELTEYTYNGKNYSIRSTSNKTSPGYTYPKFLDCQVGENATDGCHLGPYVAYNEAHEAKVRELIHKAAQHHINSIVTNPTNPTSPTSPGSTPSPTPTHYQNEIIAYTGKTDYLGGWYQVQNQWNTSGTSDFPVTIFGTYATPDGMRQANITATASNETERLNFSQAMVGKLKAIIEAKRANLPIPTYPQNHIIASAPVSYKGYSYTLQTTMNTTGYSDYPASVQVKYTTPTGEKVTPSLPAKDPTELAKVQTERISEAQSQIDMSLGIDEYAPYYVETITPKRYYGGGYYTTRFTYSGLAGKDYPGYIDVYYQKSNGINGKWTMQVKSEAEKKLFIPQGEDQAKLEIDNFPLWGVNQIVKYANIPYGTKGGTYTRYEKYNRVGTGYNYPVLVWIEYRPTSTSPLLDTRNTYGLTEAKNSEHLAQIKSTLESWVQGQMIALSPTETNHYAGIFSRRISDIFMRNAHAADTPSSILSKNNATKLVSISPIDSDVSFYRAYNIGNPVQEFYMKSGMSAPTGKSKVNVVGKNEEEARDKSNLKENERRYYETQQGLLDRLKELQRIAYSCTGQGTTIDNCSDVFQFRIPNPISIFNTYGQGIGTKIGDILFGSYGNGQVNSVLQELINKYPENFIIMYALILEEQSHLFLPIVEDYIPGANTFGLGQISQVPTDLDKQKFGYSDSKKSDLIDPITHLSIMNSRINKIKTALSKEGISIDIESIARTWNGGYNCMLLNQLCDQRAISYSKRVSLNAANLFEYYKNFKK